MKKKLSQHIFILASVVALIFAAFLYLQMCTASIYEDYQAGISRIRILHPGLLVLLILLLTVVVPGKLGKELTLFSMQFTKIAIWLCAGFSVLYVVIESLPIRSQWIFPQDRSLIKTIVTSLTHPNFSNRSLTGLIYTVLLLLVLRWFSKLMLRKRHTASKADGSSELN